MEDLLQLGAVGGIVVLGLGLVEVVKGLVSRKSQNGFSKDDHDALTKHTHLLGEIRQELRTLNEGFRDHWGEFRNSVCRFKDQ